MDNFICGGYIFSSNFDSGNLHRVELVKWNEAILPTNEVVGVEFNLWTKPDCAGTEYENLNRSWFFFCIQGGEPNKVCKFNIVNLNKQAKLFSQGMHPVIRIGENGKWERMKDSPLYNITDGDFMLSFFHKPQENTSTKYYYAFTFPFTYTECQVQLSKFDILYEKSICDVNYIVQRLHSDTNFNIDLCGKDSAENMKSEQIRTSDKTDDVRCVTNSSALESISNTELENDIYYHRELLINSIEGRRIDLLTISSFHNIQRDTEYRFGDLFPELNTPRCYLFKNKKIIFISSRVHPGETPASFVLNGFLKMILDKKNKYASILRKMYVFKIVPFLNPDGVYNGCYRSDTLGHNLNRVYLSPKAETQPSIFAVRKLIRYYHNDKDIQETNQNCPHAVQSNNNRINNNPDLTVLDTDTASSETDAEASRREPSAEIQPPTTIATMKEVNIVEENQKKLDNFVIISSSSVPTSSSSSSTRSPSSDTETADVKSSSNSFSSPQSNSDVDHTIQGNENSKNCKNVSTGKTVFKNKFIVEIKPSITTHLSSVPHQKAVLSCVCSSKDGTIVKKMSLKPSAHGHQLSAKSASCRETSSASSSRYVDSISTSARDEKKKENQQVLKLNTGTTNNNKIFKKVPLNSNQLGKVSSRSATKVSHRRNTNAQINTNINISSDFLEEYQSSDRKLDKCEDQSNMFLYIDLHGHASKKGIFMYGNHLPKVAEAVECMLLPRLMSMNCHHFHFDACVFSERNMYHKGKRDGLSKEGSGRVAIYKAIGLIKCYTLEGNYNTGKYVNVLPPRGKEPNMRKANSSPPKYTPAIFEEVGRALGPSILDLTDSNPMSRLRNSEFRSLQGLRNSLRNDIDRGVPRTVLNPKITSSQTKSKYLKNSTACCSSLTPEVFKENKGRNTTNKVQITYGKKDKPTVVSLTRKKGKVLCDVIPTTSSKFQDNLSAPPIPTKRPKVVLNKKFIVNDHTEADPTKVEFEPNAGLGENVLTKVNFNKDELSLELPNVIVPVTEENTKLTFNDSITQSTSTFDPDKPCCSYQHLPQSSTSFNLIKFPTSNKKKVGNFSRKSTTTTASMVLNQSAIGQSNKLINAAALKLRSNFAGVSSSGGGVGSGSGMGHSSLIKSLRRTSLNKDGRRLKKIKSLKADASLKRKKLKVF